jgi:hypothetical protein
MEEIIVSDSYLIERMRLIALKYALKLEMKGMKRSGRRESAYVTIKKLCDFEGNRTAVLKQLEELLILPGICKLCASWNKLTNDFGECTNNKIVSCDLDTPKEIREQTDGFFYSGKYTTCGERFGCIHFINKRGEIT